MIRGLLEKECRDHAIALGVMAVLLLVTLLIMLMVPVFSETGGSAFSLLGELLSFLGPLAALILATGLIHSEFRHRTYLFLLGLPIHRVTLLSVKYGFGLCAMLLLATVLLAGAWWGGRNAEAMTPNFLWLLFAKSVGWMWCCWSVCFAHSFLGRYRIVTGFALVIGLFIAQNAGVLVSRFGPFALISDQFAYERYVWPIEAFGWTAVLIVGFSLAGFALGIIKDSEVTEKLSKRMSSRERVVVTVVVLGAITGLSIFSQEPRGVPLNLPGAIDFSDRAANVSVVAAVSTPTKGEEEALAAHGKSAAKLLSAVAEYLECERLPRINIVHRRDFKANKFEIASESEGDIGLIRLNVLATPPSDLNLQTQLIEHVLGIRQRGRLHSDARGWVLKGFAAWMPLRGQVTSASDLVKLRGQGQTFVDESVSATDLSAWLKYASSREKIELGTSAGIGILVMGNGDEAARRRFLTGVLGYEAPHDARATLHDWLHPVEPLLKATTGDDFETLAAKWSREMKAIKVPQ